MKLIWLCQDSVVRFILIPQFLSFITSCDKKVLVLYSTNLGRHFIKYMLTPPLVVHFFALENAIL